MPYKSLTEDIPLPEYHLRWRRGRIFDTDPEYAAPLVEAGQAVEISREEAAEVIVAPAPRGHARRPPEAKAGDGKAAESGE